MAAAKRGTRRPAETRAKISLTLREQQRERPSGENATCPARNCGRTVYPSGTVVKAAGGATLKTVALLTPEQVDRAAGTSSTSATEADQVSAGPRAIGSWPTAATWSHPTASVCAGGSREMVKGGGRPPAALRAGPYSSARAAPARGAALVPAPSPAAPPSLSGSGFPCPSLRWRSRFIGPRPDFASRARAREGQREGVDVNLRR